MFNPQLEDNSFQLVITWTLWLNVFKDGICRVIYIYDWTPKLFSYSFSRYWTCNTPKKRPVLFRIYFIIWVQQHSALIALGSACLEIFLIGICRHYFHCMFLIFWRIWRLMDFWEIWILLSLWNVWWLDLCYGRNNMNTAQYVWVYVIFIWFKMSSKLVYFSNFKHHLVKRETGFAILNNQTNFQWFVIMLKCCPKRYGLNILILHIIQ